MKKMATLYATLFVMILMTVMVIVGKNYMDANQDIRKKAAPATSASFNPSTLTIKPGEEFVLDIVIDTGENNVTAARLKVQFDPEKLDAISFINGPFFPNVLSPETIVPGLASIIVGAESSTEPAHGVGVAARITFVARNTATGTSVISFSDDTFIGSLQEGSQNVLVSKNPSTITFSTSEASSVTPSLSMTPTSIPSLSPTVMATTPTMSNAQGGGASTLGFSPTPTVDFFAPTPTQMITILPTYSAHVITPGAVQPIPVTGSSTQTVVLIGLGVLGAVIGIGLLL